MRPSRPFCEDCPVSQQDRRGREWTLEAYVAHNEAARRAEEKLQDERDRRYREVAIERDKAMSVKEQADRDALALAREIQTYKDMKANELREQIASERGNYVKHSDLSSLSEKFDIMHKPVVEFIAQQQGQSRGVSASWAVLLGVVSLIIGLTLIGTFVFEGRTPAVTPQVIVVPTTATAPTMTATTTIPAPR